MSNEVSQEKNFDAISRDVTDTIKAWLVQSKHRLSAPNTRSKEAIILSKNVIPGIQDVLSFRSLLVRGQGSWTDLKEISRSAGERLDLISENILNLDLSVRDPNNGSLLIPSLQQPGYLVSVQNTIKKRNTGSTPFIPLYVELEVQNVRLPAELWPASVTSGMHLEFTVICAPQGKENDIKISSGGISGNFISTEKFCISWDRNFKADPVWKPEKVAVFNLNPFKWSGIPTSDRFYIVCVAYRIGTMKAANLVNEEGLSITSKRHSNSPDMDDNLSHGIKRPIGIAALGLFSSHAGRSESRLQTLRKGKRHSTVGIGDNINIDETNSHWQDLSGHKFTLNLVSSPHGSLHELAIDCLQASNTCQIDVKFTLSSKSPLVLTGAALSETSAAPVPVELSGFSNPDVKRGNKSICYVTLLDAVLSKLNPSSRKTNAEVSVYLVKTYNRNGSLKSDVQPLHCSTVHELAEKPVWNEKLKFEISHDWDAEVHLLFSVRMRATRIDSDKKSEREKYFAFLPICKKIDAGIMVASENIESLALTMFHVTHNSKNLSSLPNPVTYLNLPWCYEDMIKKYAPSIATPQNLTASTDSLTSHKSFSTSISSALSPIYHGGGKPIAISDGIEALPRNLLTVQMEICSFQLSQSSKLALFLSIQPSLSSEHKTIVEVTQLADVFSELKTESWIRLLFPCLNKCFELITFGGKTESQQIVDAVFNQSIMAILKMLFRSKNSDVKASKILEKYLDREFCSPYVFSPLMETLNRTDVFSLSQQQFPVEAIVFIVRFAIASFYQHMKLCETMASPVSQDTETNFKIQMHDCFSKLADSAVKDPVIRQKCLPDFIELAADGRFCERAHMYQIVVEKMIATNFSHEKHRLDFFRVLAKGHVESEEGSQILLPHILSNCCNSLESFSLNSITDKSQFALQLHMIHMTLMVLQEVLNHPNWHELPQVHLFLPVFRLSLRVACQIPSNEDSYWLALGVAISAGLLLKSESLERSFPHPLESVDFLNECLDSINLLFKSDCKIERLASFCYMRNYVFANNVLAEFGHFIWKHLANEPSQHVVGCIQKFLHSLISFVLQPSLDARRSTEFFQAQRLASHLGDLRLDASKVLLGCWDELAKSQKMACSRCLFGENASIVKMALSNVDELRRTACLILKDVLKLEMESAQLQRRRSFLTGGSQILETKNCIARFFQGVDYIVLQYPSTSFLALHQDLTNAFGTFIERSTESNSEFVSRQISLLLETLGNQLMFLDDYAKASLAGNEFAKLTCHRRLIAFYQSKDLILLYVTHLANLYLAQLGRRKHAEAASALYELSDLISWSDGPLSSLMKNITFMHHQGTQRSLKEALYEKASELYQNEMLYERSISLFQELMDQHMKYTFDFAKLAGVYENLSGLTRMVATRQRLAPKFFWITLVGSTSAIQPSLQNTSFVMRGPGHKKLSDISLDMKLWFPGVSIKHEPPPIENLMSAQPTVFIIMVEPDSAETVARKFPTGKVPERVVFYYRSNEIDRYIHVRTKRTASGQLKGECFEIECTSAMPYVLEWAEVKLEKVTKRELDTVQLAYYDVNKKNIELRGHLDVYNMTRHDPNNPQHELQMSVKGIVDAAIGGGVNMYVPFFEDDQYEDGWALRHLHDAIIAQHTLATEGMDHLERVMHNNRGLYEFMKSQQQKYNKVVDTIREWGNRETLPRTPSTMSVRQRQSSMATTLSTQLSTRSQTYEPSIYHEPATNLTAISENTDTEPKPTENSPINRAESASPAPGSRNTGPPIPPKPQIRLLNSVKGTPPA